MLPKRVLILGRQAELFESFFTINYPEVKILHGDTFEKIAQFESEGVKFDFIFSNLFLFSIHTTIDLYLIKRLLDLNGIFLFSCLGPDTFKEYGMSLDKIFYRQDMHLIGDQLMQAQFLQPVLSRENLIFYFAKLEAVKKYLSSFDSIFPAAFYVELAKSFQPETHRLSINAEIIYGHAWQSDRAKETYVSLKNLRLLHK